MSTILRKKCLGGREGGREGGKREEREREGGKRREGGEGEGRRGREREGGGYTQKVQFLLLQYLPKIVIFIKCKQLLLLKSPGNVFSFQTDLLILGF